MNIDLLSKMVKETILDRDEVSLPGVGTFVSDLVPSSFSDKGYTINPPYKRLSFKKKDTSDDQTLYKLYAESNNIDIEAAKHIVGSFLQELKKILESRKSVVFPGLGKLRATKENHYFFVPDEDLDIYPEGFGLEPVSLKTHTEVEVNIGGLRSILDGNESSTTNDSTISDSSLEQAAVGQQESQEQSESPGYQEEAIPSEDDSKAEEPSVGRSASKIVLWVILGVIALLIILLVVFVVLSRTSQSFLDFIDPLLYTTEELEIIKYIK